MKTNQEVRTKLHQLHDELGELSTPERRVILVFAITVAAWLVRPLLQQLPLMEGLNDTVIAVIGALCLFIIPSRTRTEKDKTSVPRLLSWNEARNIPWGILLTFDAGLSMAKAIQSSGLGDWMSYQMTVLSGLPPLVIILALVVLILFLTELVTDYAAVAIFLPVTFALGIAVDGTPLQFIAPVALASSCAFMLPVCRTAQLNSLRFGNNQHSADDPHRPVA